MKKYLLSFLTICIMMTGCQSQAVVTKAVDNQLLAPVAQEEAVVSESQEINEDVEETLDPWTLDNLLGDEKDYLDESQQSEIMAMLEVINEIEAVDFYDERLDGLYEDLSNKLSDYGIDLAFDMEETPSEDYDYEPWTLQSYLGFEYEKLSEEERSQAQVILDKINKAEENYSEDTAEDVKAVYDEMRELLKSFGLKVPMTTMAEFTEEHADKFTDEEKKKLVDLDEKIIELSQDDPESEKIEALYEELEKILTDAGFDSEEVLTQLESASVIYAKFQLRDADVQLVGDKTGISASDMEKFNFLVDRAVKVISKDMRPYVEHILINSDGQANVLAYVRQENDELTKWRMVLDIKDAFDEEGKYLEEYDETIVHEFGHLLTLNAGQMQDESKGTYENEEGILAEKSYLNEFYNKFWTNIKDDFEEIVDPYDADTVYDFYDKYAEQFVSDYAATNPEEDIAESFRLFVCFDKPLGNDIKDQKVLWFYEYPEMVALRDTIRSNLGLK